MLEKQGLDFIKLESTDRARLVRLCLRYSGDPHAAEDLAQETLIEAWRNQHKVTNTDQDGQAKWLSAIAQHICQRWERNKKRDSERFGDLDLEQEDLQAEAPALEFDLERDELANLLDKAMALLPPETRNVLVARYLEEAPQAQVAARLNMSESAVAVRLHRGKLALRRILTDELQPDTNPNGVQETRIWGP